MTNKIVFIAFLVSHLLFAQAECNDSPLIVIAIMVKNEEQVIRATLEPYLRADPQQKEIAYLVFDTGSSDLTLEKARELFDDYGIHNFYIFQEPFIDFSTSRNRALDLVEQCFPDACFVLMPDAEWYIQNVAGLLAHCRKEKDNYYGPYFVRLVGPALDFYTPRLIRQNRHSRFKGVVHEALPVYADQISYTKLAPDIYFQYAPSQYGQEKSKKRYLRDRDLLLREYERDPSDTQTTFYLAQTYEFLDDWENAYRYYTIRAEQPGWEEDNFLAAYHRAIAAENLWKQQKMFSWPQVHELYLHAFAMRPWRIEPLVKVAQHYLEERNMVLSFLYAKFTLDFTFPNETSFFEKDAYLFNRYTIIGSAAWYLGQYDLGEWALRKALEAQPGHESVQKNLQFYLDRKG